MINFEIDPEKLASVRAARGLNLPENNESTVKPKRPRGRPRKIVAAAPPPEELQATEDTSIGFEPASLITVDEKKLAERLAGALEGVTGIGGAFVKPYMKMTEEEARDIAEPLASYLLRRAPDSETVREFVNNYDLLAVITGTAAYTGRVYQTRKSEVEAQRIERQRAARSAVNVAGANTPEEPSEFGNGPEIPNVSPIRNESGPDVRIDGQPWNNV